MDVSANASKLLGYRLFEQVGTDILDDIGRAVEPSDFPGVANPFAVQPLGVKPSYQLDFVVSALPDSAVLLGAADSTP